MNVLIKSATIVDPKSDFNNKTRDILVEKGVISKIAARIPNPHNYRTIQLENLHVSQGWFDSSVSFGEPGFEERETIANGLRTAALSGFTAVAVNPNTFPVTSTSSDVSFLKTKAGQSPVDLLPIGALTKNAKGESLAELYDMQNAGAVAFGDYQRSIAHPNLMKIALQYSATFGGLICSFPQDDEIAGQGVMHEDETSTRLGLKGIPALAEELRIARDLYLLEYTKGKLHIPTISTAGAVDLIRDAKKRKLNVSCSVAVHNLTFTDEDLKEFDSNFKVTPPLRAQKDSKALIAGLKDGTIDMVTTDHNPLDVEHKKLEFDHASNGTIGLESAFGALNALLATKSVVKYLTRGRERFGIEEISINEGSKANITLFNPDLSYTFSKASILSKSKNSIFDTKALKGKAYGVICNNKVVL
ncbi:MAG: dihydroorotase [Flavobacteriaceae bacterium]|nr:dihydroorotase [Flavobacteriaceae bacterium]